MNTSDLIFSLRLDINDIPGHTTTDYALVNAINTVIRGIWQALGSNTITTKQVTLTPTDGAVALPDDYDSAVLMIGANGELLPQTLANAIDDYTYKIIGNTLYATLPVTMTYKATVPILSVVDTAIAPTTISLPDSLFDVLKKYSLIILNGQQFDELMLQTDVAKRIAMRDKTKLVRKPIFTV